MDEVMKANEVPEKIFLEKEKETDRIHHLWGKIPVVSSLYEHIEYIRTDAFIEKAKKWFEEHADDYNYTWYNEMEGESGITIECIEDFINYMKGE